MKRKEHVRKIAAILLGGMLAVQSSAMPVLAAPIEEGKVGATDVVETAESVNILKNGSFETTKTTADTGMWPLGEQPTDFGVWKATPGDGMTFKVEESEDAIEGNKLLHINSTNATPRFDINQPIKEGIAPGKNYTCTFWAKAENVSGTGLYIRLAQLKKSGTGVNVETARINGTTNGWQKYEISTNFPKEETIGVQIDIFAEKMTGDIWLDDVRIVEEYTVLLDQTSLEMEVGDTAQIQASIDDGSEKTIQWRSSNQDVATVNENGMVTAHEMGVAEITAYTDEKHQAVCSVSVEDPAAAEYYKKIRDNWRDRLTGNNLENKNDEVYKAMMADMTKTAQELWDSMNTEGGNERAYLWNDIDFVYKKQNTTANVTEGLGTGFNRIEQLATAYIAEGSGLYKNEELKEDIIGALEWVYATMYSDQMDVTKDLYGNWWHWFLGMPQSLCNTVILMYDELSEDLIERETKTLENFNEDPNVRYHTTSGAPIPNTAANLIDASIVSALRSSIGEDSRPMNLAAEALGKSVGYVTSGNGYYEDGSYIDHGNLAYTGGYGATLLGGIEKLIFIMNDTPWSVEADKLDSVFAWIWNGIRPLYADGAVMDMTSGRGVARPSTNEHTTGKGLMKPISHLVDIAPEAQREAFRAFAKTEIEAGVAYDENYFIGMTVADMAAMRSLLNDESLATDNEVYHKNFGVMDKSTYHGEGFDLGISMYSKRTGNFEYGNNENKKGWHQSDGAVYLYTGDQSQYADVYWPTVDAHRLAGITTDHTEGYIPAGNAWDPHTSTKTWVGGSSVLGQYGAVGMDFEGETTDGGISTLKAKKSWFTFPNSVVALGAGINSAENKETETIVDNRKVEDGAVNTLWVNGEEADLILGEVATKNADWALLEGNNGTANIGYYFPETTEVSLLKETRTGNWRDINGAIAAGSANDKEIIRSYASVAINHGINPQGASYGYVLLPGRNTEEMAAYSENPEVKILANTDKVQAVENTKYGVSGYNFWEAADVEGLDVAAETPASVMMAKEGENVSIGISNPTQSGTDTVVVLKGKYAATSTEETGVTVECGEDSAKITITGAADAGKTYTVGLTAIHEHSLIQVQAKPATCTEDGNIEYYTCDCGKWFTDVHGTDEIADKASVVVKATGHTDEDKNNECDVCGAKLGTTPDPELKPDPKPEKPGTDKPGSNGNGVVKTGDTTKVALWSVFVIAAGVCAISAVFVKRRNKR